LIDNFFRVFHQPKSGGKLTRTPFYAEKTINKGDVDIDIVNELPHIFATRGNTWRPWV
jgi:hypothetical protein